MDICGRSRRAFAAEALNRLNARAGDSTCPTPFALQSRGVSLRRAQRSFLRGSLPMSCHRSQCLFSIGKEPLCGLSSEHVLMFCRCHAFHALLGSFSVKQTQKRPEYKLKCLQPVYTYAILPEQPTVNSTGCSSLHLEVCRSPAPCAKRDIWSCSSYHNFTAIWSNLCMQAFTLPSVCVAAGLRFCIAFQL